MLTLPIKEKWFSMILCGEKQEEYRTTGPYYNSRFARYEGKVITVCFRNGYRPDSPRAICKVIPTRRVGGRQEWGAEPHVMYWVLKIVCILEVSTTPKPRQMPRSGKFIQS